MPDRIFTTFENLIEFVKTLDGKANLVELAISKEITFMGEIDRSGAGFAVVLDILLSKGYFPGGNPIPNSGYHIYKYNKA